MGTLNLNEKDIKAYKLKQLSYEFNDIPNENLIIARFGRYFGYSGVEAILNNEIDSDTMFWLLESGERLEEIDRYENAKMTFYANIASKAKDPVKAFKSLMKDQTNKLKGRKR